jgi:transcriptional regulator GlxA family with amidase domain
MIRLGLIIFPNYSLMSFAPVTVFELANLLTGRDFYELHFLSERGGRVATSVGMGVDTEPFGDRDFDTVIVGGGTIIEPATPAMLDYLRQVSTRTRRLAATCTGAFVLAQAGLLDGRRVTTHWMHARQLRSTYPNVKVDEDRIFINDGNIWTSAGMTAGIDLALALVENDLGLEVARAIAKKLVLYHRRAGGQSQFSALLELQPKSDRVQSALEYARRNLNSALTVDELASAAHLSPRQFSRVFRAETGQSPAKAVENLRVEAARLMMEQSGHPIDTVAQHTGFADSDRMRRAFLRAFGQPPQAMRRNARLETAGSAPSTSA